MLQGIGGIALQGRLSSAVRKVTSEEPLHELSHGLLPRKCPCKVVAMQKAEVGEARLLSGAKQAKESKDAAGVDVLPKALELAIDMRKSLASQSCGLLGPVC